MEKNPSNRTRCFHKTNVIFVFLRLLYAPLWYSFIHSIALTKPPCTSPAQRRCRRAQAHRSGSYLTAAYSVQGSAAEGIHVWTGSREANGGVGDRRTTATTAARSVNRPWSNSFAQGLLFVSTE